MQLFGVDCGVRYLLMFIDLFITIHADGYSWRGICYGTDLKRDTLLIENKWNRNLIDWVYLNCVSNAYISEGIFETYRQGCV